MTIQNLKISDIKREKHEVDAADQVLGRLAVKIATLLTGKHKSYFVRHLDCGDFVTVKNAAQVKVTGKKALGKIYTRYSGYPAGIKKIALKDVQKNDPAEIIRHAVWGMLPNNKLRALWVKRLTINGV